MKSGLRSMTSHYPGRCKRCGAKFAAGTRIYWSKPTGAVCTKCIEEPGDDKSQETKSQETFNPRDIFKSAGQAIQTRGAHPSSTFTVDWNELKTRVQASVNDSEVNFVSRKYNQEKVREHTQEVSSWHGYTRNQLKEWLRDGYKTSAIEDLGDFSPPLREKRRYVFMEEGEEIFIDRALSGEDNFMGDWTKRDRIPGVALEAEVMFSAATRAETVNAYNAWICKAVFALESAGIDCQVTLKFSSLSAVKSGEEAHTIVRVKQENESADFVTFSPMLSPAALRTFGFTAMVLHAESRGANIGSGFGRGRGHVGSDWNVIWDNESRILKIDCPYSPRSFPAEAMDAKFRLALKQMAGKSTE